MHRLPCAEDVREYLFPSLITYANPTAVAGSAVLKQQRAAVSSFVDAMTVGADCASSSSGAAGGVTLDKTLLTPANPVLQNFYGCVRDKIVSGASTSGTINASSGLQDSTASPFQHSAQAAAALQALYGQFALEKLESAGKKRKTYWSEIEVKTNTASAAGAGAVAGTVGGARGSSSQASAASSSTGAGETDQESASASSSLSLDDMPDFTAGSVSPTEDFQSLVAFADSPLLPIGAAQRQCLVRSAMQTLLDIVDRHITLGASAAYYKRAVACLTAVRDVARTHGEFSMFNAHLRDKIKLPHQSGRHSALWRLVVEDKLTLICSRDAPESTVSPQDADAFLHAAEEVVQAAPTQQASTEEEDLFGSMA